MALLKQLDRSATVGFCPLSPSLMAAGTVAGAIDMSFSTNSVLEVFTLDFASGELAPPLSGSVSVPERFCRIAWGTKPSDASNLPYGIIAGGLADGSICLWNPSAIFDATGHNPLLTRMPKHTGAVKGLEFNSFSPNLLASGAADGELCIWDVASPAQPSLYPALKGPAAAAGAATPPEITYISWNKKVQHILASTQVDGSTVVWDLKKQRPVITLKDPNSQRRCSVLQWNPDVATQLVVASDDDRSPTLQMWDLRNSMSPVKEFVGHTKGVLGMSWCPQDHSLLLSCSKDNRTICWDVNTTDVVCELPSQDNWNFDVQWSPTVPGIFSTSTFDGKVSVCNVLACTSSGVPVETFNADFTVSTTTAGDVKPLKKPPTWLRRPAGACFGFGGRLVSFSNHVQQLTDHATGQVRPVETGTVNITQVVTEHQLVEHSEAFENAIAGRDRTALQEFCANKAASAGSAGAQEDAETWTFMGVLFEEDARRQLLAKLGFSEAMLMGTTSNAAEAAAAAAGVNAGRKSSVGLAEQHLHSAMEQLNMADGKPVIEVPGSGEDFFNQQDDPHGFFDSLPEQPLAEQAATGSLLAGASANLSNGGGPSEPATPMGDANHAPEGAEKEDEIQKAIFVGNYDAAVDTCFKVGRLADALLIANIGGADLFKKTMQRYMRRNPRPYMAVISAMVDGDYMSLVKTRPVGQWRETLAVLATYTGADQWASLCDALASRLAQTGMHHAASLCYICAGNVDQAVAYWSKAVRASGGSVEALQAVIEKSVVLGLATNTSTASSSLADLVTTYANTLATQGRMGAALRYLEMVPGEASTSVAVLKDRIYRSGAQNLPSNVPAPPFPYQLEDIRPSQQPPTPTAAGGYGGQYGAAAQANPYASQYGAAASTTATQQSAYSSYGSAATAAPAGYGAAAAGGYGTAGSTAGYGAAAGGYGSPAAGYGSTAASTRYSQAGAYSQSAQQMQYGASAAGYGATAGYGSTQMEPSSGSYGQQAGYGQQAAYGAYGQQQPAQQVYQPRRAGGAVQAAPQPQTSFTPAATAAPPATSFTPSAPAAAAPQQPPSQQRATFTPTASATVAQPPPAAAAAAGGGYGAPPAVPGMGAVGGPPMGQAMGGMQPPPAYGTGPMGVGMQPQQQQQPPPQPAAPAGPPAHITMTTADVSKVPGDQKTVVNSLNNLFNAVMPAANTPPKKREMEDNSRRIGALFWKLNEGQVSGKVVQKLLQMCAALDAGNWPAAQHIQIELTASDWDECSVWLTALKRLIKIRQALG